MMSQIPHYIDKASTQTLREGLAEYYALNPHVTPPETQPSEFAKILLAHDVGHVIYGCDTGMYDELKILPLFWWTSECTFATYPSFINLVRGYLNWRVLVLLAGENGYSAEREISVTNFI
jgi:hypothetical protein